MIHRFIVAAIMVIAGFATLRLTPKDDHRVPLSAAKLEAMIPKQLDDWVVNDKANIILPAPEGGVAKRIYSQTVARGYVNKDGKLLMLVIAYGSNQTDSLQLHLPQTCYTAIGFLVSKPRHVFLHAGNLIFPAVQLKTSRDTRYEPVTYWTRVGDDIPNGTWERQKTKLRYGFSGKIPDGVLIRVSSIGENTGEEHALQESFISSMIAKSSADTQSFLLGKYSKNIVY